MAYTEAMHGKEVHGVSKSMGSREAEDDRGGGPPLKKGGGPITISS